jgi:hypothetical protein
MIPASLTIRTVVFEQFSYERYRRGEPAVMVRMDDAEGWMSERDLRDGIDVFGGWPSLFWGLGMYLLAKENA